MMISIHLQMMVRTTQLPKKHSQRKPLKQKTRKSKLPQSPNQSSFGKLNHGVKKQILTNLPKRFSQSKWMDSHGRLNTRKNQLLMVSSKSLLVLSSRILKLVQIWCKKLLNPSKMKFNQSISSRSTSYERFREMTSSVW